VIWPHVTAATIRDDAGNPLRSAGVIRDISERKRQEQELKAAEEKHRKIFDHALEGIFQSNFADDTLTVNPVLARMLGYDSTEEFVSSVRDLSHDVWGGPEERPKSGAIQNCDVQLLSGRDTLSGSTTGTWKARPDCPGSWFSA